MYVSPRHTYVSLSLDFAFPSHFHLYNYLIRTGTYIDGTCCQLQIWALEKVAILSPNLLMYYTSQIGLYTVKCTQPGAKVKLRLKWNTILHTHTHIHTHTHTHTHTPHTPATHMHTYTNTHRTSLYMDTCIHSRQTAHCNLNTRPYRCPTHRWSFSHMSG